MWCTRFTFVGVLVEPADSVCGVGFWDVAVTKVSSVEVNVSLCPGSSRAAAAVEAGTLRFDFFTAAGKSGSGKSLMSVSKKSSLFLLLFVRSAGSQLVLLQLET